jgi:hypothetical protein
VSVPAVRWSAPFPEKGEQIVTKPKVIIIKPGEEGLRGGAGLGTDPHRHRWLDIDAGGRPPRSSEPLCAKLVAALVDVPGNALCGKRGRQTREAVGDYLAIRFPAAPRATVRRASNIFLAITGFRRASPEQQEYQPESCSHAKEVAMPYAPARRIELTPEERRSCRNPVEQAAQIKGISPDTFREHFKHLIEQVTPKRQVVKLGAVLD